MPFQQARIEIENRNEKKIGLMLYMRVEQATPDPDRLRFRAHFRRESPCKTFDFPLLETTGPGRIVGCVLNIDTPRNDWWGRGDHKLWMDGEAFPSMLGTSTAGYFANIVPLVGADRPLHGASLVSPHGKNSLYRWHLADAINFQKSVRFTIENWQPDNANDVFYNSIVYWYGPAGAGETGDRLTEADLAVEGLRIPGAVEIEGNVAGNDWGTVLKQKYAGRVELSGQTAANITTTEPVEIDIPCETPGRHRLSLRVHPTRSFETVAVASADGATIGTATYDRNSSGIYVIGELELKAGGNRVRVTCSRPTVIDCWILEQIGP
jgi:hypothetical protein